MKIVMLGHGGANQKDRILELEGLGHSLFVDPIYPPDRSRTDEYARRWAARMHSGPWLPHVNRDLSERSRRWPRADLVWVEKAQYIEAETVERIRRTVGCPIVHYTPDVAIQIRGTPFSPIFQEAIPAYDVLVTTKDFEVQSYRDRGAPRVVLMEKAVSVRRFFPRKDVSPALRCSLGFIGRWERYYRDLLRAIARSGLPLEVRGPGWEKRRRRRTSLDRRFVKGGSVAGEEYAQRLSGMEIALGLLTKLGAEVITQRSIEIPACGTFLLAERTEKHQSVYEEGKEAEFFDSAEELIDKARHYLGNEAARRRIARAGHERFLEGPHRLDRQIEIVLAQVADALGTKL